MYESQRLSRQIDFLIEIDKAKRILRQSLIADGSRRENDAEHSWHLALMAAVLCEYAGADPGGALGEDHDPETHLIPIVLQAALGLREAVTIYGTDYDTPDGTCIRDYIHVSDLADAHVLALEVLSQGAGSGAYNLGNGSGFSVREVIETAERVVGRPIPVKEGPRRPGDPAVLVAGAEKARRELGWRPRWAELETIVRTAWEWHRAHPQGYRTARAGAPPLD